MKMSMLAGSRVLMIVAHCDDEIVCGWPIMQDPSIVKHILMVSSDRYSKDRRWCSHRKFVFMDICNRLGISYKVLDFDSNFYSLSSRDGSLLKLERSIAQIISNESQYDYVFTHNPFGEYGHHDHKYLFHTAVQITRKPILISNILMQSDWSEINTLSERMRNLYYHTPLGEATLDRKFYDRVKNHYDLAKVWTWNQPPVESCELFVI